MCCRKRTNSDERVGARLDADDDRLLADRVDHAERIAFLGDQDTGRNAQHLDRIFTVAGAIARPLDIHGQRGTVKDGNRDGLHRKRRSFVEQHRDLRGDCGRHRSLMLAHERIEPALDFVIVELEPRAQKIGGLIDGRREHFHAAGARAEHRSRGDESTARAERLETGGKHVRGGMRNREDPRVAQLRERLARSEARRDHRDVGGRTVRRAQIDQDRTGLRGNDLGSARCGNREERDIEVVKIGGRLSSASTRRSSPPASTVCIAPDSVVKSLRSLSWNPRAAISSIS